MTSLQQQGRAPAILIFLISALLLTGGCDLINPEEEIPSYLYIEPFSLVTEPAQGSNASLITEGWLSVNGTFLGAYSLPATVPILEEGAVQIKLEAGIRDNGIISTPEIYPFYEAFQQTVDLSPGAADTIRPVVSYRPETKFALIEPFEQSAHVFQNVITGTSFNRMEISAAEVFEGNYSGHIRLDNSNPLVEIATTAQFQNLTAKGVFVYLEVNYKSEAPVVFGLLGKQRGETGPGVPIYDPGFKPSDSWQKIYFNLSPLAQSGNFDVYQLGLQASLPFEGGQYLLQTADIWLDNIKLVHY